MTRAFITFLLMMSGVFIGPYVYEEIFTTELEREFRLKSSNPLCISNVDTGACSCIHERTGDEVSLPKKRCEKRAKEIKGKVT